MMLRPHHLLCTQGYEGKGYSEKFVRNMDEKIEILRNHKGYKVHISTEVDDICICCPHNNGTSCNSLEKVRIMDDKVCKYFNLENKTYVYEELVKKIKLEITKDIMEDICGDCAWYKYGMCERLIFHK